MTELDLEIPGLAAELIEEFGKLLAYTSVTAGAYSPATGAAVPTTVARTPKAIVEDYSLQGSGQAFATGLIKTGDKKFTIGNAFVPNIGDKITIDAITYTVMNVKAVYSGELVAIYELQGRQ